MNPEIPLSATRTLQFRAVAQHARLRFRINLNTADASTEGRKAQIQSCRLQQHGAAPSSGNANGRGVGCVIAWRYLQGCDYSTRRINAREAEGFNSSNTTARPTNDL